VGVRTQRPRVLQRCYGPTFLWARVPPGAGRAPLSRAARRTPLGAASKCTAPTCSGAETGKPAPRWGWLCAAAGSASGGAVQRDTVRCVRRWGAADARRAGAESTSHRRWIGRLARQTFQWAPVSWSRRHHVPAPRPANRRPVEAAGRRWCAERPWCQDRCCPDRCCPDRCCPGRCCSGRCCSGRCCSGG